MLLALVLQDGLSVLGTVLAYPLFTLLSLAVSASLSVAVFRVTRPHYYIERGSALILLVSFLGLLIYAYGSYIGEVIFHWFSLPLIYLGSVGYLAGGRTTARLVPGLVGIPLIVLPAFLGASLVALITIILLSAIALSLVAVVRFRKFDGERCKHCNTFEGTGSTFCDFCGKSLYQVRFELSGNRLLRLVAGSFLVILLLTLNVTSLTLSNSGICVGHYSLAGRACNPLLASEGSRESLSSLSSNSTLTSIDYSLKGSRAINGTFSISPYPTLSFKGAIARHEGAKENGSITISPNRSAVLYSWSEGGTSVTGLLFSTSIHYLSSGRVLQGYATLLLSEDSSAFRKNDGKDLVSFSQSVEMGLQSSQEFDPLLVDVLSPVLSNLQFLLPATEVALLGMAAGIARSIDRTNARKFDVSLGLDEREFAVFASLSALKGRTTGSDLLEKNGLVHDWQTLRALLEKLRGLGIIERRIGIRSGSPRSYWKCTVT